MILTWPLSLISPPASGPNPLTSFLIALAVSALSAPFIMRLLVALKSRQTIHKDAPESHKSKAGTPNMGGLMILAGVSAALIVAKEWAQLFLFLSFGLVGFIDDYVVPRLMAGKRGLGWMPKLAMQVLFALVSLTLLQGEQSVWYIGTALFFILFFTNAYNFSDGLDGLAGLLGIFMALGLLLIGIGPSAAPLGLLGGFIVFLCYNAPPARVFMGDVGALAIGALFGDMFMRVSANGAASFPEFITSPMFGAMAIWSLVMIAELVPPPLQIFSVKVLKKRLFPYTPIHHAFEKAGWPETRVTFLFAMVQLACSLLAFLVVQSL